MAAFIYVRPAQDLRMMISADQAYKIDNGKVEVLKDRYDMGVDHKDLIALGRAAFYQSNEYKQFLILQASLL